MMERFRSEILANLALKLLDPMGRKTIMTDKGEFEWFHPISGELVYDGLTVLHTILQRFRPNKLLTAFNEIKKIKEILPAQHGHKIDDWDTAIEQARININSKLPSEYTSNAFIKDYFDALLTVPVKSFNSQVTTMKQRWQLGQITLTIAELRTTVCQMYINLDSDDVWKQELAETSQIIALATKVSVLEKQIETTIALATSTQGGDTKGGGTNNGGRKARQLVEEWRFKFDGKAKTVNEREWHWCDQEHWANGEKVHGLYVRCHGPGEHEAFKKEADARYAARTANKGSHPSGPHRRNQFQKSEPATATNDASKKLVLSEKLRTALTTQAGLSQEAFSRIWEECERDSGKE